MFIEKQKYVAWLKIERKLLPLSKSEIYQII